ncbi:THAP4 protein, partial [Acromyrmex insinuator]
SGNMIRVPLHKALESLAWLEGTWRTENQGSGKYPTIKDFSYYDEISFMSLGQPMFNYTAQSFSNSDLKKPMHRETGFLKVNPGTNQVTLISAHNFGLTTIECGEITDKTINLNSTDITRIKEAKIPHVTQVRREFKLHDNCLEYIFYMATSNTPVLTEHLQAKYTKVSEEK